MTAREFLALFHSVEDLSNRQGAGERAILVRQEALPCVAPGQPLEELSRLASSAGAEVCHCLITVRAKPVAATFIGKGKVQELTDLVRLEDATLVIFDHAISPIQERNIERIVHCRVLGRPGLILDIFAQRATSSEGKLQVELAQLRHLSTRLVRGWTHLERQKGGIGLRGPGESQLETDRRLIGKRIKTLSRRLARVEAQRSLRRRFRHRTPVPTVSLVGYTNAGKSSLFKALTGEDVLVEDRLFATLDPTMRRLEIPGFGDVVLSDTVGFIRDLPHTLIAAFHSTLEEVASSSCLLLVNDFSDPDYAEFHQHVLQALREIGADSIPVITVFNKIDRTGDEPRVKNNPGGGAGGSRVWLSAESGAGLDLLLDCIHALLSKSRQTFRLTLAPQAGALRSQLYRKCQVVEESADEFGSISMVVKMESAVWGWLVSQKQHCGLWSHDRPGCSVGGADDHEVRDDRDDTDCVVM